MLDRLIWRATVGIGTAVAFCIALATICLAQVYQSGLVTPGHAAMWSTTGVIMDGGSTALPTMPNTRLSSLGIVNAGTTDCRWTSYTQPLAQFCLGFDGSGNGLITYSNLGAPATGTINYNINGAAGTLGGASPVNTPGTVVDVRQYGVAGGGIVLTDGQIGAGAHSLGTCDLYSPSYDFATALPTRIGQMVVVFKAGATAGTLLGGKITAVSGNHATLTTCASTTIASGATVAIAPDDRVGFQAAANNAQGYTVHIPAGVYCTSQSVLISPTAADIQPSDPSVMRFVGDGSSTYVFACGAMTTTGTDEAVFYRTATFGIGGGISDMTVDAAFLANEAIGVGGGKQAYYSNVWGWNGLDAEWTCDSTLAGSGGMIFDAIRGFTNPALATAAQEPAYNFVANLSNSNCTSITVRNSAFQNASTANIYDAGAGVGNSYFNDHPFNAAGYAPPFEIKVSGLDVLSNNQLDAGGTQPGGGNPTGIDIAGSNVVAMGNWCYFNGGYVSGNCIQIETGEKNVAVTNTMTRYSDSVTAADVVVQAGSAGAGTIVSDNLGASYGYPGVSCPSGVTAATVTTSADGKVTHC